MPESNITLYTAQTPNGVKISIALEELGLKYSWRKNDFTVNEQKSEGFLKINPNGRIPAITDLLDDGATISVWESGSILQYLVARYDTELKISYPLGSREHIEMTNWLFFQCAGVGPMQGQANWFRVLAPEKIEYAIDRYTNETKRLYSVLNTHLEKTGKPYLVGDKCTIADIANWAWVTVAPFAGVSLDEFPALKAWEERMVQRPAVEKGRHVPEKHHRETLADAGAKASAEKKAQDTLEAAQE